MNRRKTEFYVGLFVITGILCTFYLFVTLGSLNFSQDKYYSLHGFFTSVSGLKTGARIEMAGIKIGIVSNMSIDSKQLLAKVEMSINNDIELSEDIIASVKTSGIIGQKYIDILPGGSDIMLGPGEEIYNTESSLDLESIVRKFIYHLNISQYAKFMGNRGNMKKRYCFFIFSMTLIVSLMNLSAFAQDTRSIDPVLSGDCITDLYDSPAANQDTGILTAQNKETVSDEQVPIDELDDDLFDENFDDTKLVSDIADPLYYFNYAIYSFNDFLYFAALKPLAKGYKAITPVGMRKGVRNFFHNLLFPVRFVNSLLQGKVKDAGTEVGIFLINTTFGLAGVHPVAQNDFGLNTSNEDLGQTLGSYSIGNGFYLVLPILGPSTLRDTVGLVGDSFLTPVNYVDPWEARLGIKAFDTINSVSFRLGDYEALKEAAFDPYITFKDAYIQNRNEKIKK